MIDALRLSFGIALPWIAGFAVVRAALSRYGESNAWAEAGYGHFVGVLLVTLFLRASDLAGMSLSSLPISIALALVAVAGSYLAFRWRARTSSTPSASATMGWPLRWLVTILLVLIIVRVGTLAIDVLMRPLFAWDAWSQWGTKAKVWSGLRDIVPFIGYEDWLARDKVGYTDTAPNYPWTIPLLQTWMTLVLGRWDDALMNLPWLAAFLALGMGVYGQMRRLGVEPGWAAVSSYLVLSLPLLATHVALAGYADLHVAAAYALAVLALVQLDREGTRRPGTMVLLACSAIILPLLKLPGIAWLGTLVLGAALSLYGTTRARMAAMALLVLAGTVAVGMYFGSSKIAPDAAATQYRVVDSLVRHLFAFGNWNLLWYLFPLALAVGWRQAIALKGTLIALTCGFSFLGWTFFFTQAGDWVVDYTTVNRAVLHIAPASTVVGALVVWMWIHHRARPAAVDPEGPAEPAPRAAQS